MKKPNILIIYTDQQSTWSISAMGARDIVTPNIDRIAYEGAILENFYTPCAVCTPSRGCFFTGEYPSRHGAYRNNVPLSEEAETFAEVLQQDGYDTGYAGKWHLAGAGKPQWLTQKESRGFRDCRFMFNRGHWKFVQEEEPQPVVKAYQDNFGEFHDVEEWVGDENTYTTDWLCEKTLEYIENRDAEKPFLYVVSIPDPHTPFCVRKPYDTMFDPQKVHLPENYYKYCPEWLPMGSQPTKENEDYSEVGGRRKLAQYLGEVKCIDDNVGKILKKLEQEHILDETIIIFTSDHGEYMGEHGLWGKNALYPSCYRVPCLIRWPEKIEEGTRVSNLINVVDFKETLLRLAGIEGEWKGSGRDATALLEGKSISEWENKVYVNGMQFHEAGIMTDEYYVVFREDGYHMAFDMKKDPLQMINLYHDNAYRKLIRESLEDVIIHCRSVESPALSWLETVGQNMK